MLVRRPNQTKRVWYQQIHQGSVAQPGRERGLKLESGRGAR